MVEHREDRKIQVDTFQRLDLCSNIDIGNTDPICPFCQQTFPAMPARKKKCPACGNTFNVRTRIQDNKRALIKSEELGHALQVQGRSMKFYTPVYRPGSDESWLRDILSFWSSKQDYQRISEVHLSMAYADRQLRRDPFDNLRCAAKAQLFHMKSTSEKWKRLYVVKVRATTACCPECQDLSSKSYTIDQAIEAMPIPSRRCVERVREDDRYSFCECKYSFKEIKWPHETGPPVPKRAISSLTGTYEVIAPEYVSDEQCHAIVQALESAGKIPYRSFSSSGCSISGASAAMRVAGRSFEIIIFNRTIGVIPAKDGEADCGDSVDFS